MSEKARTTVAELRTALAQYPDTMTVVAFCSSDRCGWHEPLRIYLERALIDHPDTGVSAHEDFLVLGGLSIDEKLADEDPK